MIEEVFPSKTEEFTKEFLKIITKFKNSYINKAQMNNDIIAKIVLYSFNTKNSSGVLDNSYNVFLPFKLLSYSEQFKDDKDITKEENIKLPNWNNMEEIIPNEHRVKVVFFENPINEFSNEKIEEFVSLLNNNDSFENVNAKSNKPLKYNSSFRDFSPIKKNNNNNELKLLIKDPLELIISNQKRLKQYQTNMNERFIIAMFIHYQEILKKMKSEIYNKFVIKFMSQLVKKMALKFGISTNGLFHQILRNINYIGGEITFDDFLDIFFPILDLKGNNSLIKYKFLLYILQSDVDNDFISLEEIGDYCVLLYCKYVYEDDFSDEISLNLLNRYKSIYGKEEHMNILRNKYSIQKLGWVLEEIFFL